MDPAVALHGAYSPWIEVALEAHRPQSWAIPQRRLSNYLLVCNLDGEEWLRLDGGDERSIPPGASYLLPPARLVDKGSHGGSRSVMAHFDLRYDPRREQRPPQPAYADLDGLADWVQPDPHAVWGVDLPILLPPALWPAVASGLPWIVERWCSGEPIAVLQATHRLHGLLLELVDWVAAHSAPRQDDAQRIARAERVARKSLAAPFGVVEFAAAAGLGRSQFHATYRRLRGEGPGAFLRRERMQQAAALLARGDLPVAEVGRLVGYADPTVFGRVFRRTHGCAPSVWDPCSR